jgi:hypothetical protein
MRTNIKIKLICMHACLYVCMYVFEYAYMYCMQVLRSQAITAKVHAKARPSTKEVSRIEMSMTE